MYAIVFHAHQKLDRVAHRHLRQLTGNAAHFPRLKNILHFEGQNGPDATKLKNKVEVDQPWHFMDPLDDEDTHLSELIADHHTALIVALKERNDVRAAFEAAWLAHAIVDGLTPAHHYPYEAALEDLRGEDRNSRNSLMSRAVVKGDSRRESIMKSLKIIGPKGLLTTHTMFEAGAFTIIQPLRLDIAKPTMKEVADVSQDGLIAYFQKQAREVVGFEMYDKFYQTGWTPQLARLVRRELAPRMVKTITLAWYSAYLKSLQA